MSCNLSCTLLEKYYSNLVHVLVLMIQINFSAVFEIVERILLDIVFKK